MKYGTMLALVLVGAIMPFMFSGTAAAEPPYDGWEDKRGKWINRSTLFYNGEFFYDPDSSDDIFIFLYAPGSAPSCYSRLAYNTRTNVGASAPSPYAIGGIASEAGLQLKVPGVAGACDEVTERTDCQWEYFGQGGWEGCRTGMDDINARLISFFIDSDGEIKSINRDQAITFSRASNFYNGATVYIRADEATSECKDVITKIGDQWILYAYTPDAGGFTNLGRYADIVKTATGVGSLSDRCSLATDTAFRSYYIGLAASTKPTSDGYYNIWVGTTNNQGLSAGAVTATNTGGIPAGDEGAPQLTPTCENSGGFTLNWLLCPIFNASTSFVEWVMTTIIFPLLTTDPFTLSPDDPIFKGWSQFRVYGNILLIILIIVAIVARVLGFASAQYNEKVLAGRLLLSAFFINTGIYIAAGWWDLVNIVVRGISAAITAPLASQGVFEFSTSVAGQWTLGAVGTAAIGGLAGVLIGEAGGALVAVVGLFVILPLVFSLIALAITLMLLTAIKIASPFLIPLAAAAKASPLTEKYGDKVPDLMLKAGLASMAIPFVFGVASIVSFVLLRDPNPVKQIMGFLALGAALAAGGFAIQIAGGILGRIYQMASNAGKAGHQKILGNENDPGSFRNMARYNFKSKLQSAAGNQINNMRGWTTGESKGAAWRIRRGVANAVLGTVPKYVKDLDRARAESNEQFDKYILGKVNNGGDTLERAFFARQATEDREYQDSSGAIQKIIKGRWYSTYRNSEGKYSEFSAGDVAASRRLYGGDESKVQKLIKYELGKVGNDVDMYGVNSAGEVIYDPSQIHSDIDASRMPLGSFLSNLPAVLQDAGMNPSAATGSTIGAFFEKAGERRELKHTKLKTSNPSGWRWAQDADAFVQDFAENVGSYDAARGKTSPIERLAQLHREYTTSGKTLNPAQRRSLEDMKRIAQALDTRLRTSGIPAAGDDAAAAGVTAGAGGPTGGAGRTNAVIQEFIRQVYPMGVPGGFDATDRPTLTPV